jgi:alpha-tubulin suppressor-like RCC1 family protein
VAAGSTHALALDIVGTGVYAWGRSDYGQVGHTDDIDSGDIEKSPQQIAFPRSMEGTLIKDIATGPLVSMAITEENDVYTWGFVESGATGHILENDITRPKKLNVLKKVYGKRGSTNCHVLSASGGGQHSLMVIDRFA